MAIQVNCCLEKQTQAVMCWENLPPLTWQVTVTVSDCNPGMPESRDPGNFPIPKSRDWATLNPGILGLTKFIYLMVFLVFFKIILCIYSFSVPSEEGRGSSCSRRHACFRLFLYLLNCKRNRYSGAAHDWMMSHLITYAFFGLFFTAIVLSDWAVLKSWLQSFVHLPVFMPSDIL